MKYWLVISLFLNLVAWGVIYFYVPSGNFPFLIKYSIFSGHDVFGPKLYLFTVPALGLIIGLINVILALSLFKAYKDLSRLILWANIFLQSLVILYALIAVFINS